MEREVGLAKKKKGKKKKHRGIEILLGCTKRGNT